MRAQDLLEVFPPHSPVPDVLRIDRHGDAVAAVLETRGAAHDDAVSQPAPLDHRLELFVEGFGALLPAGPLRVAGRAHVDADEDVAFGPRHASTAMISCAPRPLQANADATEQ